MPQDCNFPVFEILIYSFNPWHFSAIDCAKSLGVEPVLSAEEMTDQEVEHLGIMAYAAAFREFKPTVKSSGEKVALRTDLKLVQVGKAVSKAKLCLNVWNVKQIIT